MKPAEAKSTLTPKLRFPEFIGQAMHKVLLKDVTSESTTRNGKILSPSSVMGVTKAEGIVPMETRLIASDISRYKVVKQNGFAYNPMRLNIGSIARWSGERDILVSPDYVVFECLADGYPGLDPIFLDHFRRSDGWEDFVSEKGDGSVRIRIYYKDLARLQLTLPSVREQQKIADCLSSIGEVIAAQARKVDALKTHKNALMQQLFPREGETQPRLRFPEFQNKGKWEEKNLGEIVEVASGLVNPTESPYCDLPHVGGENIESHTGTLQGMRTASELGLISGKYLFDGRNVLYSKIRPALNKVAIPDFEGICSADIYPLRPSNQKLCRQYLAYLLLSERFLKYATKHSDRSKIPKVNRDSLLAYEVALPHPPEQRRIADCLSSLDALITAETQMLETLKLHKKGLMQQLFPSLEYSL
jgi:type I restriction enzyme, S subunit